jgi:PIN domain nuclease of toxin-antitoxin system
VRLLLDTAALIYAAESPDRLSKRASTALRNRDNILEVSSISLTEIAIKASAGKLAFSEETVRQVLKQLELRVLAFTADHAFQFFALPLHHRDPFDRQLIAQALWENIAIVTPDREFEIYDGINIVW